MNFPGQSALSEEQILRLVAARAEELQLSAREAARMALRLREALDVEEDGVRNEPDDQDPVPRVPVEESVHRNYLVCLETGERMVLLRRHLKQKLNMTPEEYREKWRLPKDYPMIAEAYLRRRTDIR